MTINSAPSGSAATKAFYDKTGWTKKDNKVIDLDLFGTKEDGPIRVELHKLHMDRIRAAISQSGEPVELLECGCGGSPEVGLLDVCSNYTGVDFSETGLKEARESLQKVSTPHRLEQADICALPFDDNKFDALYCSQVIFHIPNPDAQAKAMQEMLRVLRPGGVLVMITANPFPLLFPIRSLKRLVAAVPAIGALANRIRATPPLPFEPKPLGWYRKQVANKGSIEMVSSGLPSTAFHQNVSEHSGLGKLRWKAIRKLDHSYPKASAWLGNYVQVTVTKL